MEQTSFALPIRLLPRKGHQLGFIAFFGFFFGFSIFWIGGASGILDLDNGTVHIPPPGGGAQGTFGLFGLPFALVGICGIGGALLRMLPNSPYSHLRSTPTGCSSGRCSSRRATPGATCRRSRRWSTSAGPRTGRASAGIRWRWKARRWRRGWSAARAISAKSCASMPTATARTTASRMPPISQRGSTICASWRATSALPRPIGRSAGRFPRQRDHRDRLRIRIGPRPHADRRSTLGFSQEPGHVIGRLQAGDDRRVRTSRRLPEKCRTMRKPAGPCRARSRRRRRARRRAVLPPRCRARTDRRPNRASRMPTTRPPERTAPLPAPPRPVGPDRNWQRGRSRRSRSRHPPPTARRTSTRCRPWHFHHRRSPARRPERLAPWPRFDRSAEMPDRQGHGLRRRQARIEGDRAQRIKSRSPARQRAHATCRRFARSQ